MLETTDGFRIAEEDLLLRGQGSSTASASMACRFPLGGCVRDLGLLEEAREAASGWSGQDVEPRAL